MTAPTRLRTRPPTRPVDLPRWALAPAAGGALLVLLPLVAMLSSVEWPRFLSLISSESSVAALWLSLRTSAASTLACLVLGAPMALVLARTRFTGQGLLRSLVLLPLVLPPVVGGIALLYTFGRNGLLGHQLDVVGIRVAFSTDRGGAGPVIRVAALPGGEPRRRPALRRVGYEDVAATLGGRPTTVLRTVTLPLVLPGLISGAVLAFARALGEFGATLTFAGSCKVSHGPCRWRSTCSARPMPTLRSPCRWC